MKSFVLEHGRSIAVMAVASYLVTVLAGGSVIAAYASAIIFMAIWLWREIRKGTLS